jgi:hypothetical protein
VAGFEDDDEDENENENEAPCEDKTSTSHWTAHNPNERLL